MGLIDFILNVTGVLLWLNWRSVQFDPFTRGKPSILAGTVRRATPSPVRRWHFLAVLTALLFFRAIFYLQLGPAVNWTPKLELVFVTLAFRCKLLSVTFFSLLSFVRVLVIFYFWMLTLAVINRRGASADPFQKLISLQLGRLVRWPWYVQLFSPAFAVAVLWIGLHPALVYIAVTNRVSSDLHMVGQALLVGAAIFFSLKHLLPYILLVYLISSYVYFGRSPLWDFFGTTARNMLAPLKGIPLQVGKVDFAPVVGIILIFLLLHALPNFLLAYLNLSNLTLWPQ